MKKETFIFFLLLFGSFFWPTKAVALIKPHYFRFPEPINQPQKIFLSSDPDFAQTTNNFSSGQTVYVKILSSLQGNRRRFLLNSEKKEIQRLNLSHQEGFFIASFPAPETPGIYYLDFQIEDSSGSKLAAQLNINVGESNDQMVKSTAVSHSEKQKPKEAFFPTPTHSAREKTTASAPGEKVIQRRPKSPVLSQLGNWLREVFYFFRRFFRLP